MPSAKPSCESFPVVRFNVGLCENAAESSDRNFALLRNDDNVRDGTRPPHKFDVATLLGRLNETSPLQPALDLAVR